MKETIFYLRILNPKHTFVTSLIASLKPRHANKSDWTDGVSLKIYSVGHVCARVNDAIGLLLATRSSERIKRFSRIASQNYLTVFHEYIRNSTIQQEASPAKIQDLDRSIFFFSLSPLFFSFEHVFPGPVYLSRDLDAVDLAPEETRFPDTLSL